jgi:hypothetical protein
MAISLLTLAALGTFLLLLALLQGSIHPLLVSRHFLLGLSATTLLVMAHSFILFFLLATGVELKDMERAEGWGDSFRRRTVAMKSRVFPVATLVLLVVMANFILGAAAHTHVLPGWVHGLLGWFTFGLCLLTLYREYQVLGDNNRLIAEAGARRKNPGPTEAEKV